MIDRETVERIKSAANIVDVVSEFVTLRRSGANYKGLCPFHNEKTPSFIVSPARGTCHCFGCGRGGNPVNFIMEHEQMTYPEALRWLAQKYHIEIREREMTESERVAQSERESMFIVNNWANNYFQHLLHNDPDGIAVGKQYFRMRGFRDDIVKTFQLGYDLPDRHALWRKAQGEGYNAAFLEKTGICYRTDTGEMIDRYAGRVIFPWIGVSGKVVGFTARVLDSRTKGVNQKYVNSPDSEIFHKANELYGIYQAKRAIAREDRVFLVEGQADVIAMYQSGIENVVANSGTALSLHQIQMLHRFTNNITLLYDGDRAGIHAALRGTDMILAEGMNLKVLLLPEDEDPDSFAKKNGAAALKEYVEQNQTDFIRMKTRLMVTDEHDPQKRSEGINSIIASIAVIPNATLRDIYLHDCAERIGMSEATLINQMNQYIRQQRTQDKSSGEQAVESKDTKEYTEVETLLVRAIMKWGERVILEDVEDEEGGKHSFNVAQYIHYNLAEDGLSFSNAQYRQVLDEAVLQSEKEGFEAEPYFLHHEDVAISQLATRLTLERFVLSESQQPVVTNETVGREVMHLLMDLRFRVVTTRLNELKLSIGRTKEKDELLRLMAEFKDMQLIRNELAKQLGNDIML